MSTFRINPRDTDNIKNALKYINQFSDDCSFTLADLNEAHWKMIEVIDKIQLTHPPAGFYEKTGINLNGAPMGNWFDTEFSQGVSEAAYILAFILGCKTFIGQRNCVYGSNSGFADKNGGLTWYQMLGAISSYIGQGLNSNPFPDYMNYDKVDSHFCTVSKKALQSVDSCQDCLKKCKPMQETHVDCPAPPATSDSDHLYRRLLYVSIATLLFMILSNHRVYELTNKMFDTLDNNSTTLLGLVVHGCIFFLLFFVFCKYIIHHK